MNRIQLFLIGAVVYGALHISASVMAQAAPLNTPQITALAAANTYRLSWETVAGRLYFMQVTTDLQTWNYSAPQNWYYVPAVILGTGGPITWNFSATTVRGFVRLKYSVATNITAGATGDYDGDGIANLAEISEGTDPSLSDTDGDGLTDLQEKNGGTNPNDPDTDHDGLGDLQDTAPLAFQMPQITVEHAWRDAKIVHHNLICNNQQHVKLYRSFTSSHPPVGDPGGLSERTLPPFVLGGGHQNGLDTHLQVVAAWQAAGNDPLFTSGVPTWSGWRPFVIERDLLEGTLRREYSGNILTNAEISPGDSSLPPGSTSQNRYIYYGLDRDVRLRASHNVPFQVQRKFLKIDRERAGDPAVPSTMTWTDTSRTTITLTIPAGKKYSVDPTLAPVWRPDNRILSHPVLVAANVNAQPINTTKKAERRLVLLDTEIHEVISDQIAGNTANKLPTKYFKGEPNNPMLMATRTSNTAKLRVRMGSANEPRLFAAVRAVGSTDLLGQVSAGGSSPLLDISFSVPQSAGNGPFEAVSGYDVNNDGDLDVGEELHVFERTPRKDAAGGDATANLQLVDKFLIVVQSQFDQSRANTDGFNTILTSYAGDLVEAFARGATSVSNATRTDNIGLSSTQFGLSHPLGAQWNGANAATTYRFSFADGSPAADDVESSTALKSLVVATIKANKAEMLAYSGPAEWPVTPYYSFSGTDNLAASESGSLAALRLGYAFGKVGLNGQLRISYKKTGANSIQVGQVQLTGTLDDLYDWAYGGAAAVVAGVEVASPKEPAMTQAGHATLTHGIYSAAGKVFFARVNFDTNGFVHTWDGDY